MSDDVRAGAYHELHSQMNQTEAENRHSARRILTILRQFIDPKSVLDVGCGLGSWLYVAGEMGIQDIKGLEGPWLEKSKAVVDASRMDVIDLEKGFSLGRRFDLAICLEVGEHLNEAAAGNLVRSLSSHSQAVLFSAAVPFQGGHHHVNEQFLPYWIELFAGHDFLPLDIVRGEIWDDPTICTWLRQNIVLFAHADLVNDNPALAAETKIKRPISIIHPLMYMERMKQAQMVKRDYEKLTALLRKAGTFETKVTADNRIEIRRI